jgi:hypothetical protein
MKLHLFPNIPGEKPVEGGVQAKKTSDTLFHTQVTHERIGVPTIKSI